MSELINNGDARRRELKNIILALHAGKSPEDLKQEFKELLDTVGASEIGQLEQELISSGELTEHEIKKLCDVHAAVFQDALEQQTGPKLTAGHPVHIFKLENRALEEVIGRIRGLLGQLVENADKVGELLPQWEQEHQKLLEIEKHFSRKENIIFPYLEKHGVPGPSKVMWAVHDDIRAELKKVTKFLTQDQVGAVETKSFITDVALPLLSNIDSLIFKEENIMFPMCLDKFTQLQWKEIYDQSDEIGYALIQPIKGWQPDLSDAQEAVNKRDEGETKGYFKIGTGLLTLEQVNLIFNNLPVDITFVDNEDVVRYFSQGPERIFARTPAIIGRKVENCHPPDSVHVVAKIVDEFKQGKRDKAEFWLNYNGMYVYITYIPIRNEQGEYLGTVEVSQNIKKLQEITGEKRILDAE